MFLKEIFYARLHLFNQKYWKNKRQIKRTVFYFNIIYCCDHKAEFSASLLHSAVSHDPLEIIIIWWLRFDAQETFIITNVENSWAA